MINEDVVNKLQPVPFVFLFWECGCEGLVSLCQVCKCTCATGIGIFSFYRSRLRLKADQIKRHSAQIKRHSLRLAKKGFFSIRKNGVICKTSCITNNWVQLSFSASRFQKKVIIQLPMTYWSCKVSPQGSHTNCVIVCSCKI